MTGQQRRALRDIALKQLNAAERHQVLRLIDGPFEDDPVAVLDVIRLGELPVPENQFRDDQFVGIFKRQATAAGQPFRHQPVILDTAGLGAMRTEVVVLAVHGDNRLAGGPVLAVLWDESRRSWHSDTLQLRLTPVITGVSVSFQAALPTVGRYLST